MTILITSGLTMRLYQVVWSAAFQWVKSVLHLRFARFLNQTSQSWVKPYCRLFSSCHGQLVPAHDVQVILPPPCAACVPAAHVCGWRWRYCWAVLHSLLNTVIGFISSQALNHLKGAFHWVQQHVVCQDPLFLFCVRVWELCCYFQSYPPDMVRLRDIILVHCCVLWFIFFFS